MRWTGYINRKSYKDNEDNKVSSSSSSSSSSLIFTFTFPSDQSNRYIKLSTCLQSTESAPNLELHSSCPFDDNDNHNAVQSSSSPPTSSSILATSRSDLKCDKTESGLASEIYYLASPGETYYLVATGSSSLDQDKFDELVRFALNFQCDEFETKQRDVQINNQIDNDAQLSKITGIQSYENNDEEKIAKR